MQFIKKNQKILVNAVLILLAVSIYLMANNFNYTSKDVNRLGPDFWPRMCALIIIVVAIYDVLTSLIRTKKATREIIEDNNLETEIGDDKKDQKRNPLLLFACLLSTFAYIMFLPIIGFGIATLIYLGVLMVIGRYRRWRVIIASSVIGSLSLMFVFLKIVYLSLPPGIGIFAEFTYCMYNLFGVR
ncbi:MAG: tripartite tricarboxylate transporter TctB family protein [Dehalobacterium sp.]